MIYQTTSTNCGQAAVRQLLSLVQHQRSYAACPLRFPDRSFGEMKEELDRYGVKTEGYLVDRDGLERTAVPFIAQIRSEAGDHFVTVVRRSRRFLIYLDPARGRCLVAAARFFERFSGRVLEVAGRVKTSVPRYRMLRFQESITLAALAFTEAASFLVGLLFAGPRHPIISWCGLAGTMLFAAGRKLCLFRISQRIDRRFVLPHLVSTGATELFAPLSKLKTERLKHFDELLTGGMSLAVILTMTLFSDIDFLIFSLAVMALGVTTVLLLRPRRRRLGEQAAEAERAMLVAIERKDQNYLGSYRHAVGRAELYALTHMIPWLTAFCSAAGLVIASAALKKIGDPLYLVFNIAYLLFLFGLATRLLGGACSFDYHLAQLTAIDGAAEWPLLDRKGLLGYNYRPRQGGL